MACEQGHDRAPGRPRAAGAVEQHQRLAGARPLPAQPVDGGPRWPTQRTPSHRVNADLRPLPSRALLVCHLELLDSQPAHGELID
jgi:hypothetical protein